MNHFLIFRGDLFSRISQFCIFLIQQNNVHEQVFFRKKATPDRFLLFYFSKKIQNWLIRENKSPRKIRKWLIREMLKFRGWAHPRNLIPAKFYPIKVPAFLKQITLFFEKLPGFLWQINLLFWKITRFSLANNLDIPKNYQVFFRK